MEINTLGQKYYGKWISNPFRGSLIIRSIDKTSNNREDLVCTIADCDNEEEYAKLIAAAPAMLEVCREICIRHKQADPFHYEELEKEVLKNDYKNSDSPIWMAIDVLNKLGEEIW